MFNKGELVQHSESFVVLKVVYDHSDKTGKVCVSSTGECIGTELWPHFYCKPFVDDRDELRAMCDELAKEASAALFWMEECSGHYPLLSHEDKQEIEGISHRTTVLIKKIQADED